MRFLDFCPVTGMGASESSCKPPEKPRVMQTHRFSGGSFVF